MVVLTVVTPRIIVAGLVFARMVMARPVFIRVVMPSPVFARVVMAGPVFIRVVVTGPVFIRVAVTGPVFIRVVMPRPIFVGARTRPLTIPRMVVMMGVMTPAVMVRQVPFVILCSIEVNLVHTGEMSLELINAGDRTLELVRSREMGLELVRACDRIHGHVAGRNGRDTGQRPAHDVFVRGGRIRGHRSYQVVTLVTGHESPLQHGKGSLGPRGRRTALTLRCRRLYPPAPRPERMGSGSLSVEPARAPCVGDLVIVVDILRDFMGLAQAGAHFVARLVPALLGERIRVFGATVPAFTIHQIHKQPLQLVEAATDLPGHRQQRGTVTVIVSMPKTETAVGGAHESPSGHDKPGGRARTRGKATLSAAGRALLRTQWVTGGFRLLWNKFFEAIRA
jgi:hypothetical protein